MSTDAIRVVVADDSAIVRRLIVNSLSSEDDIEVVAVAVDGVDALAKIEEYKPDAITLDIEMPNLDGISTLKKLRETDKKIPVVMFSTLAEAGASATIEALMSGASDYVTKPSNHGSFKESMESVRNQLAPKLRALVNLRKLAGDTKPVKQSTLQPPTNLQALVIGSSTGGPDALAKVLSALPATFSKPILIVQHMPPVFTTLLAERLNRVCALPVREAEHQSVVKDGEVLIAPGGIHLRVARKPDGRVLTELWDGPEENYCKPAVDVLFKSAAVVWQQYVLGVVLTGMGQDGQEGARHLAEQGAATWIQDQQTSTVWGMPGAVHRNGLAAQTLPLQDIGPKLSLLP